MKSLGYLCKQIRWRKEFRGHLLFALESSKDPGKIKVGITTGVRRESAEEGIGQDRHDDLSSKD